VAKGARLRLGIAGSGSHVGEETCQREFERASKAPTISPGLPLPVYQNTSSNFLNAGRADILEEGLTLGLGLSQ